MKVQNLAPGMIFSLIDKAPANMSVPSVAEGKVPIHFYMIISVGSEAQLQDIQCMKITSMKNKEATYELPLILNDAVSYMLPYNMFSYRRDDIDMKFFKGILVGDPDVCTADEFLHLCRDIYTDTLFGELDATLKTRIKEYQKKFDAKFGSVPKYENTRFKTAVIEEDDGLPVYSIPEDDSIFRATLSWIDKMPAQYKSWSDQDVMRALLFLGNNAPLSIISKSARFRSVGTLENLIRSFRRRINDIPGVPYYTTIVNGHEYKFNFRVGAVSGQTFVGDVHECGKISAQIKKAMRIN